MLYGPGDIITFKYPLPDCDLRSLLILEREASPSEGVYWRILDSAYSDIKRYSDAVLAEITLLEESCQIIRHSSPW